MSIVTKTAKWEYTATGGQTAFAYDNIIYEQEDLKVYKNGVLLTITVDYTVSGTGAAAGGTVTLTAGATNGDKIVIVSSIPHEQDVDLPYAGQFLSENVETAVDRLTRIAQQLQVQLDDLRVAKVTTLFPAGAGFGRLAFKAGTNPGTLKLVAIAGTSTTEVTIADNIGAGN